MPGPAPAIVLDAMGGDHAPGEVVTGAVAAAREHGVRVILAGPEGPLAGLLLAHQARAEIDVVHAPDVIPMGDSGVRLHRAPGTSAAVACGLLAAGQAAALVSAGSTGGTVATAVARLGCIPGGAPAGHRGAATHRAVTHRAAGRGGHRRPGPGDAGPARGARRRLRHGRAGHRDPGRRAAHHRFGTRQGQPAGRRAQPLLCAAPVKFTGNLEGQDALAGVVDVAVTDGFTGNVMLKAVEGSLRLALSETRAAVTAGPAGALAQFANRHRLRRLAARFDADEHGGAVPLGVAGPVVIAHGSGPCPGHYPGLPAGP